MWWRENKFHRFMIEIKTLLLLWAAPNFTPFSIFSIWYFGASSTHYSPLCNRRSLWIVDLDVCSHIQCASCFCPILYFFDRFPLKSTDFYHIHNKIVNIWCEHRPQKTAISFEVGFYFLLGISTMHVSIRSLSHTCTKNHDLLSPIKSVSKSTTADETTHK